MFKSQEVKEKKLLLKNFIENPKLTSNFFPGSKFLARRILENIDFKKASAIVEYGPSTGAITKYILRKASKNMKLLCLDLNKEFCKYIKENIKDPRLIVINDNASNVKKYLEKYSINNVDYIISGLPFSFMPNNTKKRILIESKNILDADGKLLIYQINYNIRKDLLPYFKIRSTKFIYLNIFPVFLFVCEKI